MVLPILSERSAGWPVARACILGLLSATVATGAQAPPGGLRMIEVATDAHARFLVAEIEAGALFEDLARAHSLNASATSGGYLGSLVVDDLREDYQAVLAGLNRGDLSPVIRDGDSFVIFQLLSEPEEEWLARTAAGRQAVGRNRYEDAERHYRAALAAAEEYGQRTAVGESLLDLALTLLVAGDAGDSAELFQRALGVFWSDPSAWDVADLGDVLESFSDVLAHAAFGDLEFENSFQEFGESLESALLDESLYIAMSGMLAESELAPQAEVVLELAAEAFPNSIAMRRRLGDAYLERDQTRSALDVFESITSIEPGTPGAPDLFDYSHAYRRIGDVYTRTGLLDEALQAYESALELDANSALARRGLGYAYSLTGRFDEALAEYDRALAIDPEMVMARFLVAQAQLSLGRFAEAVEAAEAALVLDPEHWESGYTKGMALLRMGRAAEGRAWLRDLGPPGTSDQVSQEHGIVYQEVSAALGEGRYDEAVSLLRAGIDETPEFSLFHLNLGVIQSRTGDHEAALETFSNIVDQGLSNHFLVHWNLAREYAVLGDNEASERHRALHLQLLHLYLTAAVN